MLEYLYRKCPPDSNDKILAIIRVVKGNIKWNNVDTVDKRSIDNILFWNSGNCLNGCWIREASVSIKLLYLAASTAAVTPGADAERGGASARIEVDMDWPTIRCHSVI